MARNKTLPKATKVLSRNNDSSQQNSTDFARIVRAKIKSNAGQKPRIAKKRGVGGTVYLHFTVSASGIATDISSSGDSMFAKSAKRALKQSVPFDTSKIHSLLPKSYTVPITYR